MRTWSTFAAAAALVAGLATASQAQTPVNPLLPTTGTREISLDGQIQIDPSSYYNLNVGYGPFLNPNLQVGGSVGFSDGDNIDSQYNLGVFANYHFPNSSALLPYVGISVGLAHSSGDSTFAYGVQGGVKYFLNTNVAAKAELQYLDYSKSGLDHQLGINLGLAVYLR
jgi:opacity protein-like surface antigen